MMGELLTRWRNGKHESAKPALPAQEQKALDRIQQEAKLHGAILQTNGKGGLPPSLVLGVFRRDGPFRCKRCGTKGEPGNGLTIHHKSGARNLVGKAIRARGHSNNMNNLVVLCVSCHDAVHDDDRASGAGGRDAD